MTQNHIKVFTSHVNSTNNKLLSNLKSKFIFNQTLWVFLLKSY